MSLSSATFSLFAAFHIEIAVLVRDPRLSRGRRCPQVEDWLRRVRIAGQRRSKVGAVLLDGHLQTVSSRVNFLDERIGGIACVASRFSHLKGVQSASTPRARLVCVVLGSPNGGPPTAEGAVFRS